MYKKLYGKLINLRKIDNSDAKSIFENANYPDIVEVVPLPNPYTLAKAKSYVNFTKKAWKTKGELQFGIENPATKKIIGMIGLMSVNKKYGNAEVGYWLGKDHWRKGYTIEAIRLILDYAFKNIKLKKVYARVDSKNTPSWKLLEKLGFVREGVLREQELYRDEVDDLYCYGLLKREYNSSFH